MEKGNRQIQYLIAYAVSFAAVTTGALSTWPSLVMPKLVNNETEINITETEIAWMVAMSSPGFMTGSLAVQYIADRFGRRGAIQMSTLPFAVGTIIVATAVHSWYLYVARFLWGVGGGMYITVGSLYLAEIADKEIRGGLTLITRFMFHFGTLLVMCIGPFVSYTCLNYLLLALPVFHFLGSLWIPESPYFYLKGGKIDAAREVLKKIRKDDDKVLEDNLLQMRADVRNEMRHSSTFKELFTGMKYRKPIIIAGGLKLTQLLTGQLILSQYLGLIILESGNPIKLSIVFIVFGIVRFSTSVMSSLLADRLGRRPLLIYSFLGTGISMFIVSIYFLFKEVLGYDAVTLRPFSFIPLAGVIASNIMSSFGYYSVISVVPAEIFPLNIKAKAMTCLSIFGGFINFCEARGYQFLKDVAGLSGVFLFLGMAGVAGTIFSVLYVPETKGKSLREIQEFLQGELYEKDEVFDKLNIVKCSDADKDKHDDKEMLEVSESILKGKQLYT